MARRSEPAPSVFGEIRASCAAVAAQARHVQIDAERVLAFAAELDSRFDDGFNDDPGRERMGDDESTAAFVISLDAINFGSGYFPRIRKPPGMSGYHMVASAWREHLEEQGPPTPDSLAALTTAECAAVFGQRLDGGPVEELMHHFGVALRDLGAFVDRVGEGRFLGVIDAASHSAARLLALLDEMPYFHDVHHHRETEVKLYKRAQITAYDLATVFGREGPGRFDDLADLTMFADNLVPHVLRLEGVLRFDEELLARIDAVDDITCGSEPEVEIRACGLHAVELLVSALSERRRALTPGDLDGVLWRRGAGDVYKATPRHRSRCVFY